MQNAKIQQNDSVRSEVKNYPPHTGEQVDNQHIIYIRDLWYNYKSEVVFFLILSACVALGHWMARYIPVELLDNVILPVQHGANIAVCAVGAWLLFGHADGLRIRKACAWALIAWGIADAGLLVQDYIYHLPVLRIGSNALNAYELLVCNFLGWILLVYPTETLRPGWLNWKRATYQLLPLLALVGLDFFIPIDLRWVIAGYPAVLFTLVVTHLRAYRIWCEENYSSMDDIDVQWVVRYLLMVLAVGISYGYVALSDNPGRVVTQNALLFFLFAYSINQILFRRDPWQNLTVVENDGPTANDSERSYSASGLTGAAGQSDNVRLLAHWMRETKPYLNPDFQLMDLRAVLPMNRTYLSQFIRDEFGCSFYQFVINYRMEEAKRLLREHPELTVEQVAIRSGFSSRIVFSRTFTKETGMSPREWSLQCNNK